jgi:hypothetical protein
MDWILIIFVLNTFNGSQAVAAVRVEFANKASCEAAGNASKFVVEGTSAQVKYTCVNVYGVK